MRMNTFLLVSAFSLVATVGTAVAGPCTARIDGFSKQLASRDAGSGPTSPGASQTMPGGNVSTTGAIQVPKAGEAPGTAATPAMNTLTQGLATSPSDARAQSQGQPTSAQVAQGAAPATGSDNVRQAMATLDRARTFDREGKEADCMSAVQEADRLFGMK
ncbi:hypothetical protein [Microvirga zambiensis]|uniref:hypothetical protein n=1 Tax=Microvirga zambiensis TaxID=1402137 RepID=UPI00191F9609|nr:hypothetical protein [Microvirga zambiensis]